MKYVLLGNKICLISVGATCKHLIGLWVVKTFGPSCWVRILNLQENKIWPIWADCRCQVPPAWLVATCPDLIRPWVTYKFLNRPLCRWKNCRKMTWKRSDLLNFELAGEQDLTYLGRFQVPGVTWLGGGHLPTPDWALGCGKFPHQTPLEPIAGSKLHQN